MLYRFGYRAHLKRVLSEEIFCKAWFKRTPEGKVIELEGRILIVSTILCTTLIFI